MMKYYLLIFSTIALNLYAQIALKVAASSVNRPSESANFPSGFMMHTQSFYKLLFSPWVISSFLAVFVAAFCWMFAISKLPLSHAYPFLAATFPGVLIFSHFLFLEDFSWQKIVGVAFISIGIIISAQG